MVGWAVLPVFLDPKTQQQPVSAYVADYVLNQVGERGRVGARVLAVRVVGRMGGIARAATARQR